MHLRIEADGLQDGGVEEFRGGRDCDGTEMSNSGQNLRGTIKKIRESRSDKNLDSRNHRVNEH